MVEPRFPQARADRFARSLARSSAQPVELELALAWLSQRRFAKGVGAALSRVGLSEREARERAIAWLESTWLSAPPDQPERVLGLHGGFSSRELRRRYRLLMCVFHPDRHGSDAGEHAKRITGAHERLRGGGRSSAEPVARVRAVQVRAVARPQAVARSRALGSRKALRRLARLRGRVDVNRLRWRVLWSIALLASLVVVWSAWARWSRAPIELSVRAIGSETAR